MRWRRPEAARFRFAPACRPAVPGLLAALAVALGLALAAGGAVAAPPVPFPQWNRWVSDVDDATALFANPAGLAVGRGPETYLELSFESGDHEQGVGILALSPLRFGYVHDNVGDFDYDTYALGTALGVAPVTVGWTMAWHRNDTGVGPKATTHTFGVQVRPRRHLSIGAVARNVNDPAFAGDRVPRGYAAGLSLRPLGSDPERLTATVQSEWPTSSEAARFVVGAEYRLMPGLSLMGHWRSKPDEAGLGVTFDFPGSGLRAQSLQRGEGAPGTVTSGALHLHPEAFRRESFPVMSRFAEVRLDGPYADQASGFVLFGGSEKSLHKVLQTLEKAERDADVSGVLLRVGNLGDAFIGSVSATHEELHAAILAVRAAGKPVIACLEEGGGAAELFVASAADRIVMPRLARLRGVGVSLELLRLKEAWADLGIDWDAATAGESKSTFHTWYTDEATPEQKEEIEGLVTAAFDELSRVVGEARRLSPDARERLFSGAPIGAPEALALGVIDRVGWYDDARRLAAEMADEGTDPARLRRLESRRYWRERWTPPPAVAVVLASGAIAPGESRVDRLFGGRTMGSDTVVRALRSAAADAGVRALVLRVDSGGGSALASDQILAEVKRLRAEWGRPIVVSMGDAAASGGYWIAAHADRIVANPLSLTGSIGVVASKPVLARLLERRGVRREVYRIGPMSDMQSPYRAMTSEERALFQRELDATYTLFIDEVAAGRGLARSQVEGVAGGRVWLGRKALEHRLVDELGTVNDAVARAAGLAGLEGEYRTLYYTGQRLSFLTRLAQGVEYLEAAGGWLGVRSAGDADADIDTAD
jgi:protease-4